MKTDDFNFELPDNLIAQYPSEQRGQSRLMTLDRVTGAREDRMIYDLPEILNDKRFLSPSGEKPLLVFNDTKVRKARLLGKSEDSGASAEFLLLEKTETGEWKALASRAKRRKIGSRYKFESTQSEKEIVRAEIIDAQGEFRFLKFDPPVNEDWLEKNGHIPLPPYIKRADENKDSERYQTVYAKQTGSAAAPTAGLHFTKEILDKLSSNGIESVFVTLHVGLGTFLPVRSENIEDHVMHNESFYIDEQTASKIEKAKAAGRKVIAVGTTSVRTLESVWADGKIARRQGGTSIFIYPSYKFKVVDALFTNFHTPKSTLLMFVSAFAGRELILESYAEAVKKGYRFFSYGEAMLIY